MPIDMSNGVYSGLLREPVQVSVFVDVTLELDNEGSVVDLACIFLYGDEGFGGTEDRCGQQSEGSKDSGEEFHSVKTE